MATRRRGREGGRRLASPRWPARSETQATELLCPDDGTHLRAVDADGIELDLCPHCHGVWLDRGELADILRRARADARADARDDEISEMVEELVDHAAEVVDDALSSPRRMGVRKDVDGDAPMPSKSLPMSQHGAPPSSSGTTAALQPDPARAAAFDVEYDPRVSLPLPDDASALEAAAVGTDLLDGATDLAGEAIGAVFEFIGGVYSAL